MKLLYALIPDLTELVTPEFTQRIDQGGEMLRESWF